MAHDLATIGQETAMFYTGLVPWHKLGKRLDHPPTSREAIKAAGLNWEVRKTPLHIKAGRSFSKVEGKYATVRIDPTNLKASPVLGIVGESYTPLQNTNAFSWFDSIVGQKAAIYETAGAFGIGERVWILAKLPSHMRVVGDDVVEKYLLLSNSHDGSSSVQIKFTPIRVVCQNTLTMALRDGSSGIRIHHNASLERNLQLAQVNLGLINARFSMIEAGFKRIQAVTLTNERLTRYLSGVFPDPADPEDSSGKMRASESRFNSTNLFENGRGNDLRGVKGSLWAAYNGVAEFVDYQMGKRTTPDNRLDSAWFGGGYLTKVRAYKTALDLAEKWSN